MLYEVITSIAEKYQRAIDIVKDGGVTLALESEPSVNAYNIKLLTMLLKQINSEYVGALFDPGNDVITSYSIHYTKLYEMTRRMIYLLVEPSHITSAWCAKSIAGIKDGCAKHHIEMKILDSIEDIEKYNDIKTIIIVCATLFWTRYTVKYIHNFGIKTIIVGAFPNDISENVSGPLLNRQQLVERVVQYLFV